VRSGANERGRRGDLILYPTYSGDPSWWSNFAREVAVVALFMTRSPGRRRFCTGVVAPVRVVQEEAFRGKGVAAGGRRWGGRQGGGGAVGEAHARSDGAPNGAWTRAGGGSARPMLGGGGGKAGALVAAHRHRGGATAGGRAGAAAAAVWGDGEWRRHGRRLGNLHILA
jgi:hypothetical protein